MEVINFGKISPTDDLDQLGRFFEKFDDMTITGWRIRNYQLIDFGSRQQIHERASLAALFDCALGNHASQLDNAFVLHLLAFEDAQTYTQTHIDITKR